MHPTDSGCWSACSAQWAGRCWPGRQTYIVESWGLSHGLLSPIQRVKPMWQKSEGIEKVLYELAFFSDFIYLTYCFCHFLGPLCFVFLILEVTGENILQYVCDRRNREAFVGSCGPKKKPQNKCGKHLFSQSIGVSCIRSNTTDRYLDANINQLIQSDMSLLPTGRSPKPCS